MEKKIPRNQAIPGEMVDYFVNEISQTFRAENIAF